MDEEQLVEVFNPNFASNNNTEIILEQYKLYVQSANLTSSLRNQANTFFMGAHTVLIGVITGLLASQNPNNINIWILVSCLAGILLGISWFFSIRSYRSLNSGRFVVIHELETKLPAQLYTREWKIITSKRSGKSKYIRQTYVEQVVPVAFTVLYILILIY